MSKKFNKLIRRGSKEPEKTTAPPRITNETVTEHRDEVLKSARKYIYPLQHTKHRIVVVSTTLFIVSLILFISYSLLSLYRFDNTSPFMYRVTQVVPFPVARAGQDFVAYENYLFELRHYMHFHEHQLRLDFTSESGQQQLEEYKKRALDKVINDAYIKQLARDNDITVTDQEVEDQITILRRQNRLGGSEQAYEDALDQNFGWSRSDFKRVIKQRLLEQKVVSELDKETHQKSQEALSKLEAGEDFSKVAEEYSEDASTRGNGGEFGFLVDRTNRDLSPITTDALFSLEKGEISGIVNTGYSLEILKKIDAEDDKIKGAHIIFNFQDIDTYINDLKEAEPARTYITLE